MRALSLAQANNCEQAKCKQCRCRCHGALHGSGRAPAADLGREWFEALPEDDPHRLPRTCEGCGRARQDVKNVMPDGAPPRYLCGRCAAYRMRFWEKAASVRTAAPPAPEPEPATFNVGPLRFRVPGLWDEDGQGA